MKTRILAAIALAVALPAAAQASDLTSQAFDQQREALNTQQTSEFQALPSQYRIDPVGGGHSDAADQALTYVSAYTMRATSIPAGDSALIGEGQSDAAAQALQNAGQPVGGHGNVEVNFASID